MERTKEKQVFQDRIWKPEMAEEAYRLTTLGLVDKNLALFFGVSLKTIESWKQRRPEFMEALRRGKLESDIRVAQSLFRRACGYNYKEVLRVRNSAGEVVRTEEATKHHAPDVTACLRWLAMRQPDEWSETQKKELTLNYRGQLDVAQLSAQLQDSTQFTTEELEMALRLGITQLSIEEAQEVQETDE